MPSAADTVRGFSLRKHSRSLAYFVLQSILFLLISTNLLFPTLVHGQATQLINSNLVIVGHENFCTTGPSGGTDSYTCSLDRPITAYVVKACYGFVADVASTGAATLSIDGLAAVPIKVPVGGITTDLVTDDIRIGQIVRVCYDGTNFQMVSQRGTAPTSGASSSASYWTATTEAGLSAEVNLGGLTSGLLKHAVSAGVSTPATAVAGTDYVVPAGNVATATALATDPPACGSNLFVTDMAAAGTLTCTQPAFSNLTGAVTDAQVPDLNILSTGLTPSQCVTTDGSGFLASTGSACGAGGGGVTTDTIGRAAFYNATTTVDGAAGLTFATDGTTILSAAERITTVSTTSTLGTADGPVVACTGGASDVTLTLPAGATTAQRRWTILKVDSGAGKCLVDANASETINGSTSTAEAATQWSRVDLLLAQTAATPNWSAILGKTVPLGVADGGTGAATLTGLVQGNATAAMTAVTSSTVGQVLRVTGANTFVFGAVDLADPDALTGVLPAANLPSNLAQVDVSNAWSDGIKQTFNPNGTSAGVNLGAHTADPSTLANGDLWYESTNNLLRARINGASVSLGAAGGTGDVDAVNITTTAPMTGGTTCAAGTCAFTLGVGAASETASGVVELATAAETTTGTDTTRAVSPDGLAGSVFGTKYVTIECVADATALTTGDGKCYIPLHPDFATWQVVTVSAHVGAATSSAGGNGAVNVDIDVCGAVATGVRCSGTNRDLLSTNLTLDQNEDGTETAAVAAVINTANDDLATGEWLRINIDTAGTGTQGLYVTLGLRKP